MRHKKSPHVILFDDTCSLCWRSVNRIHAWDRKKKFHFVPIKEGKTLLKERWNKLKNANTLILIENYTAGTPKIWIKGRAVIRILWLLGGWKKIPGLLAFLPFGLDPIYSFIANRRHRF